MKAFVIVPSIHKIDNLLKYYDNFSRFGHDTEFIIIDEYPSFQQVRDYNNEIFSKAGANYSFYGQKERKEWLDERGIDIGVIPERCHAETSFGFLIAWEHRDEYDLVIELDDDTYPMDSETDFLGWHWRTLSDGGNIEVYSKVLWVNPIDLCFKDQSIRFPRGFPYGIRPIYEYALKDKSWKSVINQGMWNGTFDLNAFDILYEGCLTGNPDHLGDPNIGASFGISPETYVTVCSMNCSFKPHIIPAFYQLYMNVPHAGLRVDRYDDIWSGIFLKKLLDINNERMSFGEPFCHHAKTPRSTFKDIKAELYGMEINEELWALVNEYSSNKSDYTTLYRGLADHLKKHARSRFGDFAPFIELQTEKMTQWCNAIEIIE